MASRQYFSAYTPVFLVNYDYIKKNEFFQYYHQFLGKRKELKISEDRQKDVRQQLCKIAGGKAVIEE